MSHLVLLFCIATQAYSQVFQNLIIKDEEICSCSDIKSETDCAKKEGCAWANSNCEVGVTETYCSIKAIDKCATILGCAKTDSICAPISGCSLFEKTTHEDCQTHSNTCTSDGEGCVEIPTSCSDLKQAGCIANKQGAYCYWENNICQTASLCSHLPQSLKTHQLCQKFNPKCTAKNEGGCEDLKAKCEEYSFADACFFTASGTACKWNIQCQDHVCKNAPNTLTTQADCESYKSKCVLNDSKDGCMEQKECGDYTLQEQCVQGISTQCKWLAGKCYKAECKSAPENYITDSMCRSFLPMCTVNDTKMGCQERKSQCSEITVQMQCNTTSSGGRCRWNSLINPQKCVPYECENAIVTLYTPTACNNFKDTCTADAANTKCILKSCADVETSQLLCQQISGCIWLDEGKCVQYTCANAPKTLKTEAECKKFKSNCTVASQGCADKTTCVAAASKEACETGSLDGEKCQWSSQKCKVKECSDVIKQSHEGCNAELKNCTTDGQKCIKMELCKDYKTIKSCIEGTDGPCIWKGEAKGDPTVKAGCIKFTGCAFHYGNQAECNAIQMVKCASNGTNCIALSKCAKMPVLGCLKGTDGDCVVNIQKSSGSETQVCELFTSCSQLLYVTHKDCYQRSNKCTVASDKSRCMDLQASCSSYASEDSCNLVTSGAFCIWNKSSNLCRDKICSDFIETTHDACNKSLSSCTTDKSKCVDFKNCSEYSRENECVQGKDGICIYETKEGIVNCRVRTCGELETNPDGCKSRKDQCYFLDSTKKCQPLMEECSGYKTMDECKNLNTKKEICTWQNGSCKKMESCADANSFDYACQLQSKFCKWTPKGSNAGSTSCKDHTCASMASGSTCNPVPIFGTNSYKVCQDRSYTCQDAVEGEQNNFSQQDCFTKTKGAYYYNTSESKCVACKPKNQTTTVNHKFENHLLASILAIAIATGI